MSRIVVPKALRSSASVTQAAHTHGHDTKNPTASDPQQALNPDRCPEMKGEMKLPSSFPAMTEAYTQVNYFLWPTPPSEIPRKKGKKQLS